MERGPPETADGLSPIFDSVLASRGTGFILTDADPPAGEAMAASMT